MILEQFYLGCLAHASYLIADQQAGLAAVVDPQRDIDTYVTRANELGVRITHVFLTHFHADYVAGHIELREQTGAAIHLGAAAEAEYPFVPLHDGTKILVGSIQIGTLETPGHTPESVCLTVTEQGHDRPHAVLTGDTLFIGDVGRPDLMASIGYTAEQLAGRLFDSLHHKLLTLPDETLLYPGHGAGSMCGKNLSTDTVSTIGAQRATNYALQPMSKTEFVARVTADQPRAPDYFSHDATLNRQQRPTLEAVVQRGLIPLTPEEFVRHVESGAQVLDTREEAAYAEGHVHGALNIGLSGKFATWAGTLLDLDLPIAIVAEPGSEREAAIRLGRIGMDHMVGYLRGGFGAIADQPSLIATSNRLPIADTRDAVESESPPFVLDVRSPGEYAAGHIPESVNIPLTDLRQRAREVPADRPVLVVCRSGYRSSTGVSVLEGAGRVGATNVVGGMLAWEGLQLPTSS